MGVCPELFLLNGFQSLLSLFAVSSGSVAQQVFGLSVKKTSLVRNFVCDKMKALEDADSFMSVSERIPDEYQLILWKYDNPRNGTK